MMPLHLHVSQKSEYDDDDDGEMEAAQASLSLHMSKCHIVGNHMSQLIYGHTNIKIGKEARALTLIFGSQSTNSL